MDTADGGGKRLSRLQPNSTRVAGISSARALKMMPENNSAARPGLRADSTSQEQVLERIERARKHPPLLKTNASRSRMVPVGKPPIP